MKNMLRALRRHQSETHKWRRLKEDWNQHSVDLSRRNLVALLPNEDSYRHMMWYEETIEEHGEENVVIGLEPLCLCFTDLRVQARFKEQPKFQCHHMGCSNMRKYEGMTMQEKINVINYIEGVDEYFRQPTQDYI